MSRYIPDNIIDDIAARSDIVEIVQRYLPLQRAGTRYKACCPFHKEKTPSFVVNPQTNTFHCFGCGKGGNVFTFVMQMDNLDFPDAARFLARLAGVIIPEPESYTKGKQSSPGSYSGSDLRERLFLLHEKLASFYESNLKNRRNTKVNAYLDGRQMPQGAPERFHLGAALDEWDSAMQFALNQGFTLDELKEAHLVSESQKSPGRYFDFFRNRLLFPIWNENGRVVGFSARQIDPEQGGGKYINSMESPIFKKSRILYGFHLARKSIGEKKCAILCEGQMDIIAMHESGCTNAVAPQGTAFGEEQVKLLKRCFPEGKMFITLALDSDSAGMKAALRDAELLLPAGAALKVALFPGGKDPDELLRNDGPEAVQKAVADAVDFFAFLLEAGKKGKDLSNPGEKALLASHILKYILLVENPVEKEAYIQYLSREISLPPETLRAGMDHELLKGKKFAPARIYEEEPTFSPGEKDSGNGSHPGAALPDSMKNPLLRKALSELLEVILQNEKQAENAMNSLEGGMLDEGPLARAVEIVIQAKMNGEWVLATENIVHAFSRGVDCPELFAILARVGETNTPLPEETASGEKENGEEKENLSPVSRQEERIQKQLRELGLPSADELRVQIERNNQKKQAHLVLKKQAADCILVIRKLYLQKKIQSLRESIRTTPPGEERNELLRKSTLLSRELLTIK